MDRVRDKRGRLGFGGGRVRWEVGGFRRLAVAPGASPARGRGTEGAGEQAFHPILRPGMATRAFRLRLQIPAYCRQERIGRPRRLHIDVQHPPAGAAKVRIACPVAQRRLTEGVFRARQSR